MDSAMEEERAHHLAADRAARREKKRNPKMKVSGRGMKRFAKPKR